MAQELLQSTHVEVTQNSPEAVEVDVRQVRSDLARTADRAQMIAETVEPKTIHYDASGVRLTKRDLEELQANGPEINR